MKLIQKSRDELAFSNALAYFIGEIGIQYFFEKGLKITESTFLNDKYQLYREKNNIDISFFGEENVVIIENKIDADITTNSKTTINSQINRAADLYFDDQCGISKDTYKNKIQNSIKNFSGDTSQLSKYYIYAFAYLLSKGIDEDDIKNHIKCFLLIPKYSEKDFKRNNSTGCYDSRFLLSEKYKIITYRDISNDFFKNATVNNPKLKIT